MSNKPNAPEQTREGRLVLSREEARRRFGLRPSEATLEAIRQRQIASELTLERRGHELLL